MAVPKALLLGAVVLAMSLAIIQAEDVAYLSLSEDFEIAIIVPALRRFREQTNVSASFSVVPRSTTGFLEVVKNKYLEKHSKEVSCYSNAFTHAHVGESVCLVCMHVCISKSPDCVLVVVCFQVDLFAIDIVWVAELKNHLADFYQLV